MSITELVMHWGDARKAPTIKQKRARRRERRAWRKHIASLAPRCETCGETVALSWSRSKVIRGDDVIAHCHGMYCINTIDEGETNRGLIVARFARFLDRATHLPRTEEEARERFGCSAVDGVGVPGSKVATYRKRVHSNGHVVVDGLDVDGHWLSTFHANDEADADAYAERMRAQG